MTKTRWISFAGVVVVALLVSIYWDYFSASSIPHEAIRLHLRLTASSIYEFHKATGRWPVAADDLASTSLPQTSPHWRTLIDNGSVTVVWNNDLKPDPKDNASVLLTYHNAGLFSKLGRVGRTMDTDDVRGYMINKIEAQQEVSRLTRSDDCTTDS